MNYPKDFLLAGSFFLIPLFSCFSQTNKEVRVSADIKFINKDTFIFKTTMTINNQTSDTNYYYLYVSSKELRSFQYLKDDSNAIYLFDSSGVKFKNEFSFRSTEFEAGGGGLWNRPFFSDTFRVINLGKKLKITTTFVFSKSTMANKISIYFHDLYGYKVKEDNVFNFKTIRYKGVSFWLFANLRRKKFKQSTIQVFNSQRPTSF
jgi:hypothetical protein